MTFLYILLFIVCLSILIVIHELGHLVAAKAFNVYCYEFSVGMGPLLFKHKKKNGETFFSLRAIPFGGYVSMYGDNADDEEKDKDKQKVIDEVKEEIPANRSLVNKKKWQQAIIMAAGITLNAVLAIVLFFISNVAFPSQTLYRNQIVVRDDTIASSIGIVSDDLIYMYAPEYEVTTDDEGNVVIKVDEKGNPILKDTELNNKYYSAYQAGYYPLLSSDSNVVSTYTTTAGASKEVAVLLSYSNISINKRDFNRALNFFTFTDDGKVNLTETGLVKIDENLKHVNIMLTAYNTIEGNNVAQNVRNYDVKLNNVKDEKGAYALEDIGMDFFLDSKYLGFGKAVQKTFVDFGESSLLIAKALGGLFIGQGWNQIGGPIAIFTQTTSVLQDFGVSYFIYLWGVISVNLAIFNLLPFPGLDGWQLLVLAVEGISKKKIPSKVKQIVSFVGLILLMALMVFVLVKDIIGLF